MMTYSLVSSIAPLADSSATASLNDVVTVLVAIVVVIGVLVGIEIAKAFSFWKW